MRRMAFANITTFQMHVELCNFVRRRLNLNLLFLLLFTFTAAERHMQLTKYVQ